jgi:Formyl transferase
MASLVIITTPGAAKRDLVNVLHERTRGKVALVIVQRESRRPLLKRISRFVKKIGWWGMPREMYFLVRLLLSKEKRATLNLLKYRTPLPHAHSAYLPPVLYVDAINSDEVYEKLKTINPTVIAIWGGLIIKQRLIETAGTVVNMHAGYCPFYRGTHGNLHALLNDDFEHIGITIHDAVEEVDAGVVRRIITTSCRNRPPSAFFTELNDRAFHAYVEIILALMDGQETSIIPQDLTLGTNYRLRDWTYEKQYRATSVLRALEKKYNPS